MPNFQCYFQLSLGGIFPSQNPKFTPPPENHPKHEKVKKYIKFTPQICDPTRTRSLELTLLNISSIYFIPKYFIHCLFSLRNPILLLCRLCTI